MTDKKRRGTKPPRGLGIPGAAAGYNPKDENRMPLDDLISRVWRNMRERHFQRTGEDLPKACPPNFLLVIEAAEEVAQWRIMEAARSKPGKPKPDGRKNNGRKKVTR